MFYPDFTLLQKIKDIEIASPLFQNLCGTEPHPDRFRAKKYKIKWKIIFPGRFQAHDDPPPRAIFRPGEGEEEGEREGEVEGEGEGEGEGEKKKKEMEIEKETPSLKT